jgi:hypothetical protein
MFKIVDLAITTPAGDRDLKDQFDADQSTHFRVQPYDNPILIHPNDGGGIGWRVDAGEVFEITLGEADDLYATHAGTSGGVGILVMAWTD